MTRHCALFLPSLPVGGAERMMLNIARELADRGVTVDLVLVERSGAFTSEIPDAVSVVDLGASRVLSSVPSLVRYLRRERPDVLLSTITPTNVVATWATALSGVDVRHVIRVARPESTAAVVQDNTFKQRQTARLARLCYPFADAIVAISEGVADDLCANTRLDRTHVHVIYNPTVTDELLEDAQEPVDHPWFDDEVPVVLGVGRLVDQKDFATLIEGFALLRKRRAARLVIFGDGDTRPELERLIDSLELDGDVQLPGFTDNPSKYMAAADVFVNAAKHEGFGNVIVEAMAAGCPVVATDCPGAPAEILVDGRYGILVPPADPAALSVAIERMLEDPTSPDRLYERASDFSVEQVVDSYEVVLFGAA